jgi:hypothetical protein
MGWSPPPFCGTLGCGRAALSLPSSTFSLARALPPGCMRNPRWGLPSAGGALSAVCMRTTPTPSWATYRQPQAPTWQARCISLLWPAGSALTWANLSPSLWALLRLPSRCPPPSLASQSPITPPTWASPLQAPALPLPLRPHTRVPHAPRSCRRPIHPPLHSLMPRPRGTIACSSRSAECSASGACHSPPLANCWPGPPMPCPAFCSMPSSWVSPLLPLPLRTLLPGNWRLVCHPPCSLAAPQWAALASCRWLLTSARGMQPWAAAS